MEHKKKRVIFIGGTSYSGSTLLEMIIGNDPKGFSCGEAWSLFLPHRKPHFEPKFPCSDKDPTFWKRIEKHGDRNLYRSIAKEFPDVEFITDNTKRPAWQVMQARRLRKQGFDVSHVLIWKTPEELASSFNKRQRGDRWKKKWIDYHLQYFSLIPEFRTVRYRDLVTNDSTVKNLCAYLDIPYFDNKKEYWHKEFYSLFGNKVAKINVLRNKELLSEALDKLSVQTGENQEDIASDMNKIYYKPQTNTENEEKVATVKNMSVYPAIMETLLKLDVNSPDSALLNKGRIPKRGTGYVMFKRLQFAVFAFFARINKWQYKIFKLRIGIRSDYIQ